MKQTLQNRLAEGKTEQVLAQLRQLTAADKDLHQQVLLTANRFAEYEKQKHANTEAFDPLSIERNKINAAVLHFIEQLPDDAVEIRSGNLGSSPNVGIPRFLTNPPFNSDYFIGREKDLTDLETAYQNNDRLLVLVNGEGGMGKTTLAAKYWLKHEPRYTHLAWLFAESGIDYALLQLKDSLHLDFDLTDSQEAKIERVLAALNNLKPSCLLVFDNANDEKDLKKNYAALRKLPNCQILLTSRVNKVMGIPDFKVKPLALDDAVRLFKHHYPKLSDTEGMLLPELFKAVGFNTLVMELLAKNLTVFNEYRTRYTLADLLADLQKKGLLAIKAQNIDGVFGHRTYVETPADTIIDALYDLSGLSDAERYLLSNFAVLPADNFSVDTLSALLQLSDEKDFDTPLSHLNKKGWIDFRDADNSFKISPVIQEITKNKNVERLRTDCRVLIKVLLRGLDNETRHDNYDQAKAYADLGKAVAFAIPFADFDVVILCQNIGEFHKDTGNLSLMMQAYQKMVAIQTDLCKAEPDNANFKNGLAISYSKLGETHTSLGNLDKVLGFYEEYNRLEKELYAAYPNNVDFKNGLAISYNYLGNTHSSLGNIEQTLKNYEECNRLSKELYESNNQNVKFKNDYAISYSKLGETHTSLGDLDKALGFYEELNKLFEELYAANPNNVSFKNGLAISYEKLGNTHTSLGDLDKALGFYEELNKLFEELYAANPNNVSFKNGLAVSYEKLGQTHTSLGNLDKALGFFEERNRLGKELYTANPNNVSFKNGLALSYQWLGYFFETEKNDKKKAKENYQNSKLLLVELVTSFPNYVAFQKNLKWVENKLGEK